MICSVALETAGWFPPRQIGLKTKRLGLGEIVETKIRGQIGLSVPHETRHRLGDIGPLDQTLSPPRIILRDHMKLGQVISDESDREGFGFSGSKSAGAFVMRAAPHIESILFEKKRHRPPSHARWKS